MWCEYDHVGIEEFPVQVHEWSESLTGRTYRRGHSDPGFRIKVLSGQNDNGPIMAMFQEEEHGLYHYYRNICGSAPDFDTREKVVDLIKAALYRQVKILVDFIPRPEYSYRLLAGTRCQIVDIEKTPKGNYSAVVETQVSLDDKGGRGNEAGTATIRRRIAIEDLTLRHVIETVDESNKQMVL